MKVASNRGTLIIPLLPKKNPPATVMRLPKIIPGLVSEK